MANIVSSLWRWVPSVPVYLVKKKPAMAPNADPLSDKGSKVPESPPFDNLYRRHHEKLFSERDDTRSHASSDSSDSDVNQLSPPRAAATVLPPPHAAPTTGDDAVVGNTPRSNRAADGNCKETLVPEPEDSPPPQDEVLSIDLHDNPICDGNATESADISEEVVRTPAYSREYVSMRECCTNSDLREPLPRMFYFFLASMNLHSLRAVARDLSVKQAFAKVVLTAKIFMSFMLEYSAGVRDVSSLLSERRVKAFEHFRQRARTSLIQQEMPTVAHLEVLANTTGKALSVTPHPTLLLQADRTLSNLTGSTRTANKSTRGEGSQLSGRRGKRQRGSDASTRNVRARKVLESLKEKPQQRMEEIERRRAEKRVEKVDYDSLRPEAMEISPDGRPKTETQAEEEELKDEQDPTGNPVAGPELKGSKGLSDSEFARLLLVLRDDEGCRSAFLNSGQVLIRPAIDRGDRPADFWHTKVEKAFNDPDTTYSFDCRSVSPDINPSLPPPVFRSGSQLETVFKSFRSNFMGVLNKYRASGQNARDIKEFLVESNIKEESAVGRRVQLAACILQLGGMKEDHAFLTQLERTIGRSGKSGYHAPLSQNEDEDYVEEPMTKEKISGKKMTKGERMEKMHIVTMNDLNACAKNLNENFLSVKKVGTNDKICSRASVIAAGAGSDVGAEHVSEASPKPRGRGTPENSARSTEVDALCIDKVLVAGMNLLQRMGSAHENQKKMENVPYLNNEWEHIINILKRRYEELKKQNS